MGSQRRSAAHRLLHVHRKDVTDAPPFIEMLCSVMSASYAVEHNPKAIQQYGLLTGKYGISSTSCRQAVAYARRQHRPSTTHHDATMSLALPGGLPSV